MSYYQYPGMNVKRHCILTNDKLQMLCYTFNLKCLVTNVELQCQTASVKAQMLSYKSQNIISN